MSLTVVFLSGAATLMLAWQFGRKRTPRLMAEPPTGSSWLRPGPVPLHRDSEPIPAQLGPYQVEMQIGEGAMSRVFRALDTRNGQRVALKVPNQGATPEHLEAFDRELEICRALSHPNLVAVLESGFSQDYFYVALELVQGSSLESLLYHGPLHFEECWQVARQLSAVLYFAHRRGLVHGDIKPANVMVTREGHLKMLDFGIGGLEKEESGGASSVLGTPEYMAPEVLHTGQRTVLSDQYSAGVLLYEIITGRLPSSGLSPAETNSGRLRPLTHWRARVPAGWLDLTRRMLQKNPAQRFADLGEVQELLSRDKARFL